MRVGSNWWGWERALRVGTVISMVLWPDLRGSRRREGVERGIEFTCTFVGVKGKEKEEVEGVGSPPAWKTV